MFDFCHVFCCYCRYLFMIYGRNGYGVANVLHNDDDDIFLCYCCVVTVVLVMMISFIFHSQEF